MLNFNLRSHSVHIYVDVYLYCYFTNAAYLKRYGIHFLADHFNAVTGHSSFSKTMSRASAGISPPAWNVHVCPPRGRCPFRCGFCPGSGEAILSKQPGHFQVTKVVRQVIPSPFFISHFRCRQIDRNCVVSCVFPFCTHIFLLKK